MRSMGMPTDKLLRIVESNDTSTHFVASASGAVAGSLEHCHLAELGDVVHAGVRARVRSENHSLVEHYAYAVGHASRSLVNRSPILVRHLRIRPVAGASKDSTCGRRLHTFCAF